MKLVKKLKLIFCVGLFSIFFGCATQQTPLSEATKVRAKLTSSYAKKSNTNDSELIFIRDSGLQGSICLATIYINDQVVGGLLPEEYLKVYVPSNKKIIVGGAITAGGNSAGSCFISTRPTEFEIEEVKENSVLKYRVKLIPGDNLNVEFDEYKEDKEL